MSVRSGQSVTVLFTTRNFSTGVGVNADSLPTGTLYLNGTANGASVTVTNISTGLYKAAVTLPTLAVNDEVQIIIAATVSSVADTAVIWGDTKDFFAASIPDVAAGAAGGLFIAGSNAATTVASFTCSGVFSNNGITDVAQTGDNYARIGVAGVGLTNLGDTRIGNLDAAVSTRLASASYTAPDNTSVTAIKAQTDKLTFTVANQIDANIKSVAGTTVNGNGSAGTPWGP